MTDGNQPNSRSKDEPDESGWDDVLPAEAKPAGAATSEPPPRASESNGPGAQAATTKSEPPGAKAPSSRPPAAGSAREEQQGDKPEPVRAAAPDPEPVPATPAKLEPDDEDDDDDEDEDEDDSEPAKARAKPSREIEGTRARVKPVERDRANRVARPAAQQKPGKQEAQSKGGMLWVALIAAALLGAWWLLHEPKKEEAAQLDTVAQPEEPELENAPVAPPPEPVAAPAAVEPAEPAELAEPSPAAEPVAAEQKPAPGDPSPQAAPAAAQPAAQPAAGDGTFDRIVALKALGKSAEKASRCRMRGEAPDTAEVLVTFEPSGRVRDARIASGAYVGTLTGKCILERLSETTIAPFSGSARTVTTSVGVR